MNYAESQTNIHERQLADSANSAEALARELDDIVHECEHAAQFSKNDFNALIAQDHVVDAMRHLQIHIRASRQADAAKQAAALMRSAAALIALEKEQQA